jgi:tRNA dimethylallyltransferase
VGPTASGKSALAMAVARADPCVEIVSMDSMQVYRGMDIGTAKPDLDDRAEVVHHLVDVASPTEDWSVVRFQQAARAAVADIEARGRRALLVGGTGLYVRAVVDDLRFPGEDRALRATLEQAVTAPGGLADAYARLCELDPPGAARIDPGNARRIVRALEVIELTGRPFSEFGDGLDRFGPTVFPVRIVGCWLPRAALVRRIDQRIDAMRRAGFLEEVAALRAGPGLSRTAGQAIGYRELLAHLDGEPGLEEAYETTRRRTRSFARRQRMWFRRDPRVLWLGTAENPDLTLPAVLALWSA